MRRILCTMSVPLLLVITPALFTGCATTNNAATALKAGPAIPGLKLSGNWYSQEFGDMKIVHTGKAVSGSYEDPRGPDHNGTFRGQIIGDLVRLEWIKPGNPTAAIMPVRGRAWLRASVKDGVTYLSGMWGYEDNDHNGGPWNAEKSAY